MVVSRPMIRVTPILRAGLLAWARAYGKAARLPLRKVSRLAYGDGEFFNRLRRGHNVTGEAYDKAMAWLGNAQNWPAGAIPAELADPLAPVREAQP